MNRLATLAETVENDPRRTLADDSRKDKEALQAPAGRVHTGMHLCRGRY
jgi:hypothetical protein